MVQPTQIQQIIHLEQELKRLRSQLDEASRNGDRLRIAAIDQEMRQLDEHRQQIKWDMSDEDLHIYEEMRLC